MNISDLTKNLCSMIGHKHYFNTISVLGPSTCIRCGHEEKGIKVCYPRTSIRPTEICVVKTKEELIPLEIKDIGGWWAKYTQYCDPVKIRNWNEKTFGYLGGSMDIESAHRLNWFFQKIKKILGSQLNNSRYLKIIN